MEPLLLWAATFNMVLMPYLAWGHGCRLNEAAIARNGSAARRSLAWWLATAVGFAASFNTIAGVIG